MTHPAEPVKVALVDDHKLFRKGIVELINGFTGFAVIWEANNGKEMMGKIVPGALPQVVLLDINMPVMNGYDAAVWLKEHWPDIKILALSMDDNEESIIKMLKASAKGYILKDADPAELQAALHSVATKGFYYSELVTGTLLNSIRNPEAKPSGTATLNNRELEFLRLACTELTYKEIADQMHLSARTIDGYRESLFEKLEVKNRVGLVIYAIKHGIMTVS
jgi:DNA-binding NarL/FixJ family response regulator